MAQIQSQPAKPKQKIITFLWCNNNAEEMMNHYVSIFKDARPLNVSRCGDSGPGPKGSVLTVSFELAGQKFMGVNGGPMYTFTEAVSLLVNCDSQEEVDHYWTKLGEGGVIQPCGWLKDKFGLSWQVFPTELGEMLSSPDPARSGRVMKAMMTMKRPDIAKLRAAFEGA